MRGVHSQPGQGSVGTTPTTLIKWEIILISKCCKPLPWGRTSTGNQSYQCLLKRSSHALPPFYGLGFFCLFGHNDFGLVITLPYCWFFLLQRGNELLGISLISGISPGLSWLGRGWLKKMVCWLIFFTDASYANTWGRKEHCYVADRGKILQASVYCLGCLWGLHGYAK